MGFQAGEPQYDHSWGNMWKLFKLDRPQATIAEFNAWMKTMVQIQESIAACPWCKCQPALRVIPCEEGLEYSVACEDDYCPANPSLNESFTNAIEAVAEWNSYDNANQKEKEEALAG